MNSSLPDRKKDMTEGKPESEERGGPGRYRLVYRFAVFRKNTLSRQVGAFLSTAGLQVEILDGDTVRTHLCRDLGFSKEDREENIRRIGFVAGLLAGHGVIVLVSAIAPYRAIREEIRAKLKAFVEVYVDAPLDVCESRDVKGHYEKARRGELKDFTGIDSPYEPPLQPEVDCRTDRETIEESTAKVLDYLKTHYPDVMAPAKRLTAGAGGLLEDALQPIEKALLFLRVSPCLDQTA